MARAVANLETIAAGILEENSVVVTVFIAWPFNISCTCLNHKCCQFVDLAYTVGPQGDPTFVGDVFRRFRHPEEFGRAIGSFRLILQPSLNLGIPREPEGWQERLIKRPRLSEAAHPKINVIKKATHR
jgi:hypothetical protein